MKSIYIYSDESGVFDKHHHDIFVYGGIVCVGQDKASSLTREYLQAEKNLRKSKKYKNLPELKAYYLNNDDKRKLYRIIKDCYKFAVIIDLKKLMNVDFASPQAKQRFLDYAFKRGVKASLNAMNSSGAIDLDEELEIKCYVDEHSRATNGKYRLRDSLYNEFKYGMYISSYDFKPIARNLADITINYCNSETTTLVRGADILANRILFETRNNTLFNINDSMMTIIRLP